MPLDYASGLPAQAASLECGDFYRLEHNIEAIRQIQMPGSGEPADFVFETHWVRSMKDTPVTHDSFTSTFQEGMSWETVTLVAVHVRIGGEQIPKVVVAPQGKRHHMIHVESPAEPSACPDTFLGVEALVSPSGIGDITFVNGHAQ